MFHCSKVGRRSFKHATGNLQFELPFNLVAFKLCELEPKIILPHKKNQNYFSTPYFPLALGSTNDNIEYMNPLILRKIVK